jgi:Winged helix DNA-binding domain (DUF1495)
MTLKPRTALFSRMHVLRESTRLSIRRSRGRELALMAYREHGALTVHEVAELTGVRVRRVRGILHGLCLEFAHERALVPLGLARPVPTPRGVAHELTEAGLAEARTIASLREELRPV